MIATGWLGWTPKVALRTNVNQIALALEGRIDFVKKTNPWGDGEEASADKKDPARNLLAEKSDPAKAAMELMSFVSNFAPPPKKAKGKNPSTRKPK